VRISRLRSQTASRSALAQVRGLKLGCKLRFWAQGSGGRFARRRRENFGDIECKSVHLALKVMPHTLNIVLFVRSYRFCAIPINTNYTI